MDKQTEASGDRRQDTSGRVVSLEAYRAQIRQPAMDTTGYDRRSLEAPRPLSLRTVAHRQRMLRHLAAQARTSATI